jgi:hypothetical protein
MAETRHGVLEIEFPLAVWVGDDPDLALVHADMAAWAEAHPCDCHALCRCKEKEGETRWR